MAENAQPAPPLREHDVSRHYITRRLHKNGSSLGVYIPGDFCKAVGLLKGSEVRVYLIGSVICIQKPNDASFYPRVIAVAPRAPEEKA